MTPAQIVGVILLALSAVTAPLVDRRLRARRRAHLRRLRPAEPLEVCGSCGLVKYLRAPCATCALFATRGV